MANVHAFLATSVVSSRWWQVWLHLLVKSVTLLAVWRLVKAHTFLQILSTTVSSSKVLPPDEESYSVNALLTDRWCSANSSQTSRLPTRWEREMSACVNSTVTLEAEGRGWGVQLRGFHHPHSFTIKFNKAKYCHCKSVNIVVSGIPVIPSYTRNLLLQPYVERNSPCVRSCFLLSIYAI